MRLSPFRMAEYDGFRCPVGPNGVFSIRSNPQMARMLRTPYARRTAARYRTGLGGREAT